MDKFLGQEIPEKERWQFLQDNADAVEEIGYTHRFTPDELAQKKESLDKVIKNRAIDVVFDNKHIDKADTESGKDGFMQSLEDNILEPRIYDLIKEESRKHKTDSLMADGGSLLFEKRLEQIVDKEFEKRGLQLLTFSAQLEFSRLCVRRLIVVMR